ncbi:uncharacterized protein [Coffea arabica]|uniref:Uncharacterized protein isoform X2 n=1 Tax=Coffea arabica TaxID=13443 RepID=A0ABM4V6N3_COFAR
MSESSSNGPTLDIWIPSEHVSAANCQVRGNQLWGTDIYTDDSDLVAVLMHTGYCHATASQPEATIQELRVAIRVLPPQEWKFYLMGHNLMFLPPYTCFRKEGQFLIYSGVQHIHLLWSLLLPQLLLST